MMANILKVACVQLNNKPDRAANLIQASEYIREAAVMGAQLICTPEYTCQMIDPNIGSSRLPGSQMEDQDERLQHFRALAAELNVWLLIGSLGILVSDGKIANRSFLINNQGKIAARYDKIHLADINYADGRVLRESNVVVAGDKAVVAQTPWGGIGMSICYDVRFPALFTAMAKAGAIILFTPAAYSPSTGEKTWELFQRSRAAETNSYVIAPAQVGLHEGTRRTWGHSMIVGPDGDILAEGSATEPGIIIADLDLNEPYAARERTPSLKQSRSFTMES